MNFSILSCFTRNASSDARYCYYSDPAKDYMCTVIEQDKYLNVFCLYHVFASFILTINFEISEICGHACKMYFVLTLETSCQRFENMWQMPPHNKLL